MDDTTNYAVGWFTLALINAGIAQERNHDMPPVAVAARKRAL